MGRDEHGGWPPLLHDDWRPTRETLHRYLQIVGKIRMALVPAQPHWAHAGLSIDARGVTTGPMPYQDRQVEILLDLVDHRLVVDSSDGRELAFELGRRPACADFHRDLFDALEDLEIHISIRPHPYDLGEGPSFPEDTVHRSYDARAVTEYWRVLAGTDRVLTDFASRFTGEASPIQLFWHLLDLSYTRHPRHGGEGTGGNVDSAADRLVTGFGFTPGDERGISYPAFFSYTSPEPDHLVKQRLDPEQARWATIGSQHRAVLAYDAVRTTPDPHQTLLAFYQSAFSAGTRAAACKPSPHLRDAGAARGRTAR